MVSIRLKGEQQVLATLNATLQSVTEHKDELTERLAEIGRQSADASFSQVVFTDLEKKTGNLISMKPVINVTVESIENGHAVVAEGDQVGFAEFGAGVHYNGGGSYPGELPAGIVGIGEFGRGHGKQDAWFYTLGGVGTMRTHGNPPSCSLYNAAAEIKRSIVKVAKEVFK